MSVDNGILEYYRWLKDPYVGAKVPWYKLHIRLCAWLTWHTGKCAVYYLERTMRGTGNDVEVVLLVYSETKGMSLTERDYHVAARFEAMNRAMNQPEPCCRCTQPEDVQ
ncbi:unnamed protein product [marine sediment metagenome]|uniref:Uncharacterized protein n=1 Tax=marine sediment metagenome TaxID=412755 RepID=X0SKD1_9ZZZZ